jgi:DNA polymerase III subunit delta
MPVYFYWGDDDFRLQQAVKQLREKVLDPTWASFNFDRIGAEQADGLMVALNQVMSPGFGGAARLVWLVNTSLGQRSNDEILAELSRTLPHIPAESHLLLTSNSKPDGRSKAVKLLQQYGEVREFALIPTWKTEDLLKNVRQMAQQAGVKLSADAQELLTEAVANDTRQLLMELEKLQLFAQGRELSAAEVGRLVTTSHQNSLQLATVIRQGDTPQALGLVADLIRQNEAPLRIIASLTRQFRTWMWVKLLSEAGERDPQVIAKAAEIGNPKRVYFLQKEVQRLKAAQLLETLPLLLDLEVSLKQGAEPITTLQTKVIQLCQIFATPSSLP